MPKWLVLPSPSPRPVEGRGREPAIQGEEAKRRKSLWRRLCISNLLRLRRQEAIKLFVEFAFDQAWDDVFERFADEVLHDAAVEFPVPQVAFDRDANDRVFDAR